METNFIGDPKKIEEVHRLLDEWRNIRVRIIDLAMQGQWNEVEKLVMVANGTTYVKLGADVDDIVALCRHNAEAFAKDANDTSMSAITRLKGWAPFLRQSSLSSEWRCRAVPGA